MVGVLHPTCLKDQGTNLGRHLELSERQRAFARKRRREKQARRRAAHMKDKFTRARSRMDELTFSTFNIRTAAAIIVNSTGFTDNLPRICVATGCILISRLFQRRLQRGKIEERAAWGWTGDKGGYR